jgi:hypothetical protein
MNGTRNCAWCGKTGIEGNGYSAPKGWVYASAWDRKCFCGNKCRSEYINSKGGNNNKGNGSSNEGKRSKTDSEIAYEIERKRKQDQLRDEQERKAEARKEQKILKYQEEGKKFLLFTVEKPILTFFIFFLILPIIFLFGGAILFGGGRHVFVIALIPMIVFAFFYLKETFKK